MAAVLAGWLFWRIVKGLIRFVVTLLIIAGAVYLVWRLFNSGVAL